MNKNKSIAERAGTATVRRSKQPFCSWHRSDVASHPPPQSRVKINIYEVISFPSQSVYRGSSPAFMHIDQRRLHMSRRAYFDRLEARISCVDLFLFSFEATVFFPFLICAPFSRIYREMSWGKIIRFPRKTHGRRKVAKAKKKLWHGDTAATAARVASETRFQFFNFTQRFSEASSLKGSFSTTKRPRI